MKQPGITFFWKSTAKVASAEGGAKAQGGEEAPESKPPAEIGSKGSKDLRGEKRELDAGEKKAPAGRLKRLKKSAEKTTEELVDVEMPSELEDTEDLLLNPITENEGPVTDKSKEVTAGGGRAAEANKAKLAEGPSTRCFGRLAPKKQTTPTKEANALKAQQSTSVPAESETKEESTGKDSKYGNKASQPCGQAKDGNSNPDPKLVVHPFVTGPQAQTAGSAEGKPAENGGAAEAFQAVIKAFSTRASGMKASAKDGVGAAALAAAELHKKYTKSVYLSWKGGAPTPYSFMAEAFEVIANTTKRQEKACVLIDAFRTILASRSEDLIAAVRLTANELSPPHEGLELGLGEATLKDVGLPNPSLPLM